MELEASQRSIYVIFTLRQQWIRRSHTDVHDHAARPKPTSSGSQLHAPATGAYHCPQPTALSRASQKSISKGMGGWLIAVKRKHRKFPVGHVNERDRAQKACQSAHMWEWPAWLPSQTITELLSQVKRVQKQQVTGRKPLLSGDPVQSFLLRNSYCLLLLSLKRKKNFPSPRKWHIRVKNPIKEQ